MRHRIWENGLGKADIRHQSSLIGHKTSIIRHQTFDISKGRTIRKLIGGAGAGARAKYQKNIRARENEMKKNSCTPINPKKYSCYGLKKIGRAHV